MSYVTTQLLLALHMWHLDTSEQLSQPFSLLKTKLRENSNIQKNKKNLYCLTKAV